MDIEFAEGDRAAGESFKRLAAAADEFEAYANPHASRIARIADAYAALTDARPWRPAGTEGEARKHLGLWAGIEFDPAVVLAFLSLEGLPELRSFARAERAAEEPARAPEQQQAPAVIRAREEPSDGDAAREEVVHAGEPPAQYPWDAGTPS